MATKRSAERQPWRQIQVPLSNLHLDLENYRHEPVESEAEAIAWLYNEERTSALARDIAEYGALSPLELIGVIPMEGNPDHFVAVEGNRRLCSLLLLRDPDRAPTPEAREVMKRLARTVALPAAISVVQFADKEQAKHWVDLRHLGPQDGQGLRAWNPSQKERAADDGGPNRLALAVLDRAREGGWLTGQTASPAVTTLTRYLKNREVRAALGLGHHRDLVFTHDGAQVDAALKQFLLDSLPNGDGGALVHSRSNDAQRAAYARDLRDRGIAPSKQLAAPEPPQPVAVRTAQARNRPDPGMRKFLIPNGFVCNAKDRNLRMLFNEMRRTPIDDHEFANAYLMRALIERVSTLYLKKVDPGYNPADDQALVARCALKLDPTQKVNAFKPIRIAGQNKDSSHSPHTLGAAVHAGVLLDRKALVRVWENWEFALREMLAVIPTK